MPAQIRRYWLHVISPARRPKLKYVNLVLFAAIIILDSYIIAAPWLPAIFAQPSPNGNALNTSTVPMQPSTKNTGPIRHLPNQLDIPAIQLDQPIYEGRDTYAELDKGVWRWPASSTPDKGSNTVLLGHRFTYSNPKGVFYFLNLVKVGDLIRIRWDDKLYTYRVYQIEVVTPDHIEILQPTTQPTLTMYTCTPTWLPVNRLVIKAHLEAKT